MSLFTPPTVWFIGAKLIEYHFTERGGRDRLEAIQLRKFRRLAAHAARRSPYYGEVVRANRIDLETCTPADFPVLTKSELMQRFDEVVTDRRVTHAGVGAFLSESTDPDDLYLGEYQVCHTSGSSGEVGYFVFSRADWGRAIAQHARARPLPPFPQKETVAFVGATDGHYAGVSAISSARRGLAGLVRKVILCEVNEPLSATVERLNAFQPQVLVGYTAILCALAEERRRGRLNIAPRRIDSSGEAMTQADRDLLDEAFGAQLFNLYVCAEHQLIAAGRAGEGAMVLHDDDLICEFHDDHLIVTNLFNRTLPLIRYRMADVVRPRAPMGVRGPYREIDALVGRTEMAPRFVNRLGEEDAISPIAINQIFILGVRKFQMELTGPASFRFLVRMADGLGPDEAAAAVARLEQRLKAILHQKLMDHVAFDIVRVDELPIDPATRKFRLIVDRRPEVAPAAR